MQLGISNTQNSADVMAVTAPASDDARQRSTNESSGSGLSFRDVLDAINPLNHIPIVSDIFESATEHQPSTFARLVGGTLFGGPIGFVASLAGVIYRGESGQSPIQSAYAALTGESASSQVAFAETAPGEQDQQVAQNITMGPPSPDAQKAIASLDSESRTALNGSLPTATSGDHGPSMPVPAKRGVTSTTPVSAQTVLDLYGASPASAHTSYRRAQLRPYLKEVSVSQVL